MNEQQRAYVMQCLANLQEAQGLINAAAASLSNVDGFADEWPAHQKAYDAVKSLWYIVDSRRSILNDQARNRN